LAFSARFLPPSGDGLNLPGKIVLVRGKPRRSSLSLVSFISCRSHYLWKVTYIVNEELIILSYTRFLWMFSRKFAIIPFFNEPHHSPASDSARSY